MPAADPLDQQATRTYEVQLREAVACHERPPVELEWFATLPMRIRHSGRLLEAAQIEAKALLEFVREAWMQAHRAVLAQDEQIACAKATPRNLEHQENCVHLLNARNFPSTFKCLERGTIARKTFVTSEHSGDGHGFPDECLCAPDPLAWNGLGRRKKCYRAFDAVGRAFTACHWVTIPAITPSPAPMVHNAAADAFSLDHQPYSLHLSATPELLHSPIPEICNTVCDAPGLTSLPNGLALGGLDTPVLSTPDSSAPCLAPAYPSDLVPGALQVFGHDVDPHLVWIVAQGCYAWAPHSDSSLREAAYNIVNVEQYAPGALGQLMKLFFLGGVGCHRDVGQAFPAIPALARGNPAPALAPACGNAGIPAATRTARSTGALRAFPQAPVPATCL
ncbi:hypothetical protein BDV93DRAFT_565418 [Ceratobasidium sp. AG-I]|nr:hypothetical protein BDV93DRAFT_565418 [Ceratobasidium sp. AG-I]